MRVMSTLPGRVKLTTSKKEGDIVFPDKDFTLQPGENDVPDEFWVAWAEENKGYAPLASGAIAEIKDEKKTKEKA